MRKDYNKLVRDKVPDLIEAAGKKFLTLRLSEDKYKRALKQKLVEETREVQGAESITELTEELADVAEVMDTLIVVLGISWQEVREAQKQKRLERGGFEERLKLMWVEEKD
ncbi:nucleoside triphosphate pyrophosphohydrolase [Leptothoe sp. LEGE 181152]|nr:nucleoside triphosphate pyrophosphohydrolase [Leptothoe sp. LEGE 181152]